MDDYSVRRARIRYILALIILATLPCYCIGLVYVWVRPVLSTPTPELAVTITRTGQATSLPLPTFIIPTAIVPPTLNPTEVWFTPTRFVFPTMTPTEFRTPTATLTLTHTPTATFTLTSSPTNTYTVSPTETPSPTATITPTETPTPTNTEQTPQ